MHLVCRFGAVKMSPDGSLIWSLIGFGQVKNMGLVVFYLPFSSYLWRPTSVKYSSLEISNSVETGLKFPYILPHLVKTICRVASMIWGNRRCNVGNIVHLKTNG